MTRPNSPIADDDRPVAVVTGGAVRVGAAIVAKLVAEGFAVWVHYHRSHAAASALAQQYPWPSATPEGGGIVGIVGGDLTRDDARASLVSTVSSTTAPTGGRLDLLVNNAASFERGAFLGRSDDDLRRVLALNLIAPMSLVRRLAPCLSPEGLVVNLLDLGAHHPWRNYTDHCVAKAGLWHATRALAAELAPLRINAISPGTVAWPDDERFAPGAPGRDAIVGRTPRGRIGEPRDIADAVTFLMGARHMTGQTLVLDGGRLAGIAGDHA